ncbi:MAG: hypothetical protein EB127_19630, partial [Alphaproteobacteria bacterium]|nr:hypothetical protein [Alphaproteobacteria bacterium]
MSVIFGILKLLGVRFLYKRIQELYSAVFIYMFCRRHIIIDDINYNLSDLDCIGARYGTDKVSPSVLGIQLGWAPHDYAWFYDLVLSGRRGMVKYILECGIGTQSGSLPSSMGPSGMPGASLRMWRDYFPEAIVFGLDIDKNILFKEDRIKTFWVDQTDKNTIELFINNNSVLFDIVIDDGLHTFEAGVSLFEGVWDRLSQGGLYFIEDVEQKYVRDYIRYFRSRKISATV